MKLIAPERERKRERKREREMQSEKNDPRVDLLLFSYDKCVMWGWKKKNSLRSFRLRSSRKAPNSVIPD